MKLSYDESTEFERNMEIDVNRKEDKRCFPNEDN